MNIEITVQGKQFKTVEEAQAWIDSQDPIATSLAAFVAYKKANGAQRINTKLIEEYARWVQKHEGGLKEAGAEFAKSQLATTGDQAQDQSSADPASEQNTVVPTAKAPAKNAAVPEESSTEETQTSAEDNSTQDDLDAVAPSLGESKHVAGPSEDDDEDPLLGLDL